MPKGQSGLGSPSLTLSSWVALDCVDKFKLTIRIMVGAALKRGSRIPQHS